MSYIELQILIGCLITVDVAIIVVFICFIKRLKYFSKSMTLEKEIGLFESLIADSEKAADHFRAQLEAKHLLIKSLEQKLDSKIAGLNLLLNRADGLLSSYGKEDVLFTSTSAITDTHRSAILSLAQEGCKPEEIADKLSLSKGEVKLLLDLKEKFSKLQSEESVS